MYTFWKRQNKYGSFYKLSDNMLIALPQKTNGCMDHQSLSIAVSKDAFDDEELEIFLKDMSNLFKIDITTKNME